MVGKLNQMKKKYIF